MRNQERIQIGACDALLLGTIAGFVPDAERVRGAFAEHRPDVVGLGVPPEDLPTLRLLAQEPARSGELPELDDVETHFQALLRRFGATQVPSPDLEAAYQAATEAGVAVEALDLDDALHSTAYTSSMKVRHLIRTTRRRKKILGAAFPQAQDAYDLTRQWDAALTFGPLLDLERERERHMANRLRELAAGRARVLGIVPVALLAGVAQKLGAQNRA